MSSTRLGNIPRHGSRSPILGPLGWKSTRRVLAVCLALPLLLLAAGFATGARAQQASSAVDPGQIEQRFDDRPRIREKAGPEIQRPEAPVAPLPEAEREFLLTAVTVEGSTVYDGSEFVPLYEHLLTHRVKVADLHTIAKQITARYEKDDYVLSKAVVEGVETDVGLVTIRVIEGYVGEILIEGQVEGREGLLQDFGNKITGERPIRLATIERYTLLIEDLPGVGVRPLLEPQDEQSGAHKLVLVLSHDTIAGFARADNRGSRSVGPVQLWAAVTLNSALGLYETTRARFITTPQAEELKFFDFSHTETVNSEGTTVTLSGSYSASRPGGVLKRNQVESHGKRLEIQAAHPVIRSRELDVYVTGRLGWRNSEEDNRFGKVFNDQITALRAGAVVSFDDPAKGRNWINAEVSRGLDIFGASDSDSPSISRRGANSEFTKITGNISRYQKVADLIGVLVGASGQKSSGAVFSAEEMGVGGERYGRAFDAAEITGPDGAAARVELQYDGSLGDSLIQQYQFYGFYDIGAVWTSRGRESLTSAGFGVRSKFKHGIFGSVEIAAPLTRPVSNDTLGGVSNDPRVFFVLSGNL
jgi:hemolysin activation/secretion protein